MPNDNVQAVRIANDKLRPLSDKFGQLYNFCKALQVEYQAENWASLFPNDAELVSDGSADDGRAPITNADIVNLMTMTGDFIAWMELTGNARRNLAIRMAVNPERF